MRFLRTALRPLARGYATSVTGYGREVEGFVGAVGNTPLVSAASPTSFHPHPNLQQPSAQRQAQHLRLAVEIRCPAMFV